MDVLMGVNTYIAQWTAGSILLRFLVAFLVGGLIGLDRGIKRRGAGLRTHMLVCISSALVMMTGQYIYMNFPGNMDMARLGAQVISGVGFLGVGTIIVTGWNKVRGITTAASIWSCACLGLAIGVGFVFAGVTACILMGIVLHFMECVDNYICKRSKYFDFVVETEDQSAVLRLIKTMQNDGIIMNSFEEKSQKGKTLGTISLFISLTVPKREQRSRIHQIITDVEGVYFAKEM